MGQHAATWQSDIETPTGKGSADENFPVASRLISAKLRPHVMAYYAFARAADDIADNPTLSADDKLRRLDAMRAGLDGPGPEKAQHLAASLAEAGVTDRHARDLLDAFRQDAVKQRYESWGDLLGYCELSANPVGRFLMDLHGESRALWPASDALCTVLQILNHLQDCQDDYRAMDRVYIPVDMLAAKGLDVTVLDGPASPEAFRSVLDAMLDRCDAMIAIARTRPAPMRSRRLHAEMAVITYLAARLSRRLRRGDPLAGRIALSRLDFAGAALRGVAALVVGGRR